MLEIKDISLSFGGTAALRDVQLVAERGKITGLIGPNGSGKTTCLNVVSGMYRPDAGSVLLDGEPLPLGDPVAIARAGVGRTFQVPRLATRMTVLDNMLAAGQHHPGEGYVNLLRPRLWRRFETALVDRAKRVLDRFLLLEKSSTPAGALSGGQMKILSLGMALMADCDTLLLDEPAAGVSPAGVARLMEMLDELRSEGRALLIIEHNMDLVTQLCDTLHVLDSGQVVAVGPPEEIQRNAQVIEAYLGDSPMERDDRLPAGAQNTGNGDLT